MKLSIKCGMSIEKVFELPAYSTFEQRKQSVLKRFGNIQGTNRGENERQKVKRRIQEANSLEEIESSTHMTTWRIHFRH